MLLANNLLPSFFAHLAGFFKFMPLPPFPKWPKGEREKGSRNAQRKRKRERKLLDCFNGLLPRRRSNKDLQLNNPSRQEEEEEEEEEKE